jgi:formate-dependent phosphoribosylglycinamide formyltransferase (GAR transformylase)
VDLRIFGKKEAYKGRRMAVTLAEGSNIKQARARALAASKLIKVKLRK